VISQAMRGATALAADPNPSVDQWTRFYAAGSAETVPLKGACWPKTHAIVASMQLNFLSVEMDMSSTQLVNAVRIKLNYSNRRPDDKKRCWCVHGKFNPSTYRSIENP
jgi:predicted alpha/beta-hydrolase family hydrolase